MKLPGPLLKPNRTMSLFCYIAAALFAFLGLCFLPELPPSKSSYFVSYSWQDKQRERSINLGTITIDFTTPEKRLSLVRIETMQKCIAQDLVTRTGCEEPQIVILSIQDLGSKP